MEPILVLYFIWCLTFGIIGWVVHSNDRKNRLPKFPSDIYDRLWWKYFKQVSWYLLFWAADIPWVLSTSPLRKFFKKDH